MPLYLAHLLLSPFIDGLNDCSLPLLQYLLLLLECAEQLLEFRIQFLRAVLEEFEGGGSQCRELCCSDCFISCEQGGELLTMPSGWLRMVSGHISVAVEQLFEVLCPLVYSSHLYPVRGLLRRFLPFRLLLGNDRSVRTALCTFLEFSAASALIISSSIASKWFFLFCQTDCLISRIFLFSTFLSRLLFSCRSVVDDIQ